MNANNFPSIFSMNQRPLPLILFLLIIPALLQAQSATTEALMKKYTGALELFFYNNTLRMLNQGDDKQFDELIRDIEKMRFVMIKKGQSAFGKQEFDKLVSDYKRESFEEVLTSRHDGKNFDIFLKEKNGNTKGMLVLINDATSFYVLDILGRIPLDKITSFYNTLDKGTDIGSKIKAFAGDDDVETDEEGNQNH